MKAAETICHKVDESLHELKNSIRTGNLNVLMISENLHKIRRDAQAMENGLKLRRKLMIEAGLEGKYQQLKGEENTPPGINKTADIENPRVYTPIKYHVTVKDHNEVIYDNAVHAGVMSFVEAIRDIDDEGVIEGQTQKFWFGHDLSMMFAIDQLRQGMEAKYIHSLTAFANSIRSGIFKKDPAYKKKILDLCNNVVE